MGVIQMKRFMILLFLSMTLGNNFSIYCNIGHASITKWQPGSYGNVQSIKQNRPPLPVYVTISFDKNVTEEFVHDYFKFVFGKVPGHKKTGNTFIFRVAASTNQIELSEKLNQANRHFDPEIEKLEKLEQERLKFVAAQKEADHIKAIAQEKTEQERKAKEEALKEKAEQERRAAIQAERERTHKIYEEQKKIESGEQERKENEGPSDRDIYTIIRLPENFRVRGHSPLNEYGQIAGCIDPYLPKISRPEAAIWDIRYGIRMSPLSEETSYASAINEQGLVALTRIKKFHSDQDQVAIWNINDNSIMWGPTGTAQHINNHNQILLKQNLLEATWNFKNNAILPSNQYTKSQTQFDLSKFGPTLSLNGKTIAVILQDQFDPTMRINRNNEVVAITYKRNNKSQKTDIKITKWCNGTVTHSKPFNYIRELKNTDPLLLGFNNAGQILLGTHKQGLFLLTPKNKSGNQAKISRWPSCYRENI